MVKTRYTLSDLPYSYGELEPVISKEVLQLHRGKHHKAYVDAANSQMELLEKLRIDESTEGLKGHLKHLSFNVGGHVLHDLFWRTMRAPKKDNSASILLSRILDETFGCVDNFKREFTAAALSVEGSGWAALMKGPDNDLLVVQIEKHNLLVIPGYRPALVLDVWEHAYYLDYKNDRASFIQEWWDVVNWDEVEDQITQ